MKRVSRDTRHETRNTGFFVAYATAEQVIERHGAGTVQLLTGRDGDGAADFSSAGGVLDRALADAAAEIDTYLAAKYDLPLTETPDILTRLAVDIAVYRLASAADVATEERRMRYEDAVKLLERIASGEASLGLASPGAPSRAWTSVGTASSLPRRFSRETMARLGGGAPREWE